MPQDYTKRAVRAAAILVDGSYVAGTVIDRANGYDNLILYVSFTIGSLTSAEVKVEFSADGTTYYQESIGSVSGGTDSVSLVEHAFVGTGNYRLSVPIKDRFIKVSAQGTGTITTSSMTIDAILGTTS